MNRKEWDVWADFLQRWELGEIASALLEATSPLHGLMAQLVYLSSPILSPFVAVERVAGIAAMLETPGESHLFAAFLREETKR